VLVDVGSRPGRAGSPATDDASSGAGRGRAVVAGSIIDIGHGEIVVPVYATGRAADDMRMAGSGAQWTRAAAHRDRRPAVADGPGSAVPSTRRMR
jgi:transposase InsO family protein